MSPDTEEIDAYEQMNTRMRHAWADRIEMEFHGVAQVSEATTTAIDDLTG